MWLRRKAKNKIAFRLLMYMLTFSSLITLVLTILQLYFDYRQDINLIEKRIEIIQASNLESITQSLWVSNIPMLQIQLEGILRMPDTQYLEIYSKEKILVSAGTPRDNRIISENFPITYTYRDKKLLLGHFHVIFTLDNIYQRLINKALLIFFTQGVKTFLVSTFILILFQVLVTRHLQAMAAYTRELSIEDLDKSLVLSRESDGNGTEDELEQVVTSINTMRNFLRLNILDLKESEAQLKQDLKTRKDQEKELRHLRNYLSNIIESMPSVLVGVDLEDQVTQWNREAEKVTEVPAKKAIGQPLAQAFPRLSGEMQQIRRAIETGEKQIAPKQTYHQNGEIHYEDVTVYPLVANGVAGAVIRIDDVTDKIRMEEMMIQSEKMLSVGGLAAGMAHEINNPLAGMIQTANVMEARLTNVSISSNVKIAEEAGITMEGIKNYMEARGIPRMIQTINESGKRMAEIVNNMLSFARKSEDIVSTHNVSELLDKTIELAATDYDLSKHYDFKQIQIGKEYQEDLPTVICEGVKIQQVLLNLLRNGAQAMQEAGTQKPRFVVRTWFEEVRKIVCLEIEDNGPGMTETIRKRVFEPFFTTKPMGVGTGLGLSVSYFIITENHRGEMDVESQPGSGSKFIIRLPLERGKTKN